MGQDFLDRQDKSAGTKRYHILPHIFTANHATFPIQMSRMFFGGRIRGFLIGRSVFFLKVLTGSETLPPPPRCCGSG